MDCGTIGRPTLRRCAPTTPAKSRSACGRGLCRSSSGIRPSIRLTTRGRWRIRTSPPRCDDFGTWRAFRAKALYWAVVHLHRAPRGRPATTTEAILQPAAHARLPAVRGEELPVVVDLGWSLQSIQNETASVNLK